MRCLISAGLPVVLSSRCVCELKVWFVFLDLHHEVVQVDELGAHGQAAERRLGQDLVEAVVVLDELSQRPLVDTRINRNRKRERRKDKEAGRGK